MKGRKFLVLSTLAAFGVCVGALSIYRAVSEDRPVVIIGDGYPSIGFENAKIELVVFEDFLCHTCRYFSMEVFPAIQTTYVDRGIVKYVMVPLATTSRSKEIANAALAVYHQAPAVYFPYVRELFLLFANGTLEYEDLVDAAAKFKVIDLSEFESSVKTRRYDAELAHNYQLAKKAMKKNLRTPAVFINGHSTPDISFESISLQIEKDLKAMSLSHYSNFSVFDLFGIFRTPLFGRVFSHWPQSRNPCGHSKSAQNSLKTFKTLIGDRLMERP